MSAEQALCNMTRAMARPDDHTEPRQCSFSCHQNVLRHQRFKGKGNSIKSTWRESSTEPSLSSLLDTGYSLPALQSPTSLAQLKVKLTLSDNPFCMAALLIAPMFFLFLLEVLVMDTTRLFIC